MGADDGLGPMQLAGQGAVENLMDERAFAGAADAGDGDQSAQRKGDVEVLEVVLAGALDDDECERGMVSGGLRRPTLAASATFFDSPLTDLLRVAASAPGSPSCR